MTVRFVREVRSEVPVELLFSLSLDIDEHVSSMSDSAEQAVGGVTSGGIGLGETVTWKARHFGIPFTMTSRIEELDSPHSFVDAQLKGPFAFFRHRHEFSAEGTGSLMRDEVEFRAPLGVLGTIAEKVALRGHLEKLIDTRNGHLLEVARDRLANGSAPTADNL